MGAAGRDFHNFNVYFRNNNAYEVVAFTAGQIPNIAGRVYPPELAGPLYPKGIPIYPEEELERLIRELRVDEVVLAYSDLRFEEVMEKACRILAAGACFKILGYNDTVLRASKPVIAVTASRTGAGKSTLARKIARILKRKGLRVVVVRHPMPYGKLKWPVQRFERLEDLEKYECTIEEREEYEPHILEGNVVYAGVDYQQVLKAAEREADVILWDGGNNDWPFIKPDLHVVVVDPLRCGDELRTFPGLVNVLLADVIVINKVNVAGEKQVRQTLLNVSSINPRAKVVLASSEITVDRPELIRERRVLVVEDGPSVTHGNLGYGAGYIAALKYGAAEVVDPRPYAIGSIKEVFEKYKHIGKVLPAMGYGSAQMKELEKVINSIPADSVVLGTPTDLSRYLNLNKKCVKVKYELVEQGKPTIEEIIEDFISEKLTPQDPSR